MNRKIAAKPIGHTKDQAERVSKILQAEGRTVRNVRYSAYNDLWWADTDANRNRIHHLTKDQDPK